MTTVAVPVKPRPQLRPAAGEYITNESVLAQVIGMNRDGSYDLENVATEDLLTVTPAELVAWRVVEPEAP